MAKQFATLDNLSVFNEYMPKMTPITQAAYDLLTPTEKNDPYKVYFITDATVTGVDIDDTTTALNKVWSSSKVSQSISNPNLLDNPWFTVNQRGQSSYNGNIYTVDRWKASSAETVTINSDKTVSISVGSSNGFFQQFLESDLRDNLLGKTVTISAIVNDTLYTTTGTMPNTVQSAYLVASISIGDVVLTLRFNSSNVLCFYLEHSANSQNTYNVKAVKLEVGSISTLHLDVPPNYQQELAKCKRYFQKLRGDLLRVNTYTARLMFFLYPLEVEMRTVPAVVGTPIVKSMTAVQQTGFTFAYNLVNYNQAIQIVATKESHGLTDGYVNCGDDGLQLSADL